MCVCLGTCVYVCVCVHVCMCVCVYVCVCVCVCMCTCVYVCTPVYGVMECMCSHQITLDGKEPSLTEQITINSIRSTCHQVDKQVQNTI